MMVIDDRISLYRELMNIKKWWLKHKIKHKTALINSDAPIRDFADIPITNY